MPPPGICAIARSRAIFIVFARHFSYWFGNEIARPPVFTPNTRWPGSIIVPVAIRHLIKRED